MKKFLIKVPEKYTKDGVEKTFWHTVGTLVMFEKDGNLKLPAIGLNAKVYPVEGAAPVEKMPEPASEPLTSDDIPY